MFYRGRYNECVHVCVCILFPCLAKTCLRPQSFLFLRLSLSQDVCGKSVAACLPFLPPHRLSRFLQGGGHSSAGERQLIQQYLVETLRKASVFSTSRLSNPLHRQSRRQKRKTTFLAPSWLQPTPQECFPARSFLV